jgi:hypothetical protein
MLPTQISNNATLIANMLELIHLQNYSPTRLQKETSTAALKKLKKKKMEGVEEKTATKFYPSLMLKEALNTKIPLPSQD